MTPGTLVDAAAIATFATDGAVPMRGLLDAGTIESLREAVTAVLDRGYDPGVRMGRDPSGAIQVDGMWREEGPIRDLVLGSPIAAASAALTGSGAVRVYEDLFQHREPGPGEAGWHRDAPYWPVTGHQLTNVWFTLEPVSPDTGGIHIVAGSHLDPDEMVYGERGSQLDPARRELAFGCEPGDVIIFHPRALHTGYGAEPDRPRRTFTIRYMGDDARWRPRSAYYHDWMRDCGLAEGAELDHPGFPLAWSSLAPA